MGKIFMHSNCSPSYGYNLTTLLKKAVMVDWEFLEDVATNSKSIMALENLIQVGKLMFEGKSDSHSDVGYNLIHMARQRIKYLKNR